MQSMAERSSRQTLLTLRRIEERAALRDLAAARRAVEKTEQTRALTEAAARAAEPRRAANMAAATTAGGGARREAWQGRLRQAAQIAEEKRQTAARAWQ